MVQQIDALGNQGKNQQNIVIIILSKVYTFIFNLLFIMKGGS